MLVAGVGVDGKQIVHRLLTNTKYFAGSTPAPRLSW
jgi:hypothetical protein